MAYEYDIFLSYPRSGQVGPWVQEHFEPLLKNCLDVVMADPPRIFIDKGQATGVVWPDNIKRALLRSRLMVAIWTPPFFRSNWCIAEWSSMLERETILEHAGNKPERGLIYPIVYSDGRHFDERAKATQIRYDLSKFTYPYASFKETAAYLQLHDLVMGIAEEIEAHLDQVPPWDPNWPIIEPPPADSPARTLKLASL